VVVDAGVSGEGRELLPGGLLQLLEVPLQLDCVHQHFALVLVERNVVLLLIERPVLPVLLEEVVTLEPRSLPLLLLQRCGVDGLLVGLGGVSQGLEKGLGNLRRTNGECAGRN